MSKNDKSHVLNILTNKQPELFLYYKTRDLPYTDCMNIILETLDFIKKDSFQ